MALLFSAAASVPRTRISVGEQHVPDGSTQPDKAAGSLGIKLPHPLLQEVFLTPCRVAQLLWAPLAPAASWHYIILALRTQRLLPCVLGSCLGQVVSASPSHQHPGLAWPTYQADTLGLALASNGRLAWVSILTCPSWEPSSTCREKETEPVRGRETGVWASFLDPGWEGSHDGQAGTRQGYGQCATTQTPSWTRAFGAQGLILIKQQLPFSDQLLCAM